MRNCQSTFFVIGYQSYQYLLAFNDFEERCNEL